MAAEYNYQNGQITYDFHFVRYDEKCKLSGLPAYVGGDRCMRCPHNVGSIHPFSVQLKYGVRLDNSYVYCNHKDAKDSENCGIAKHAFREQLQDEALCALCY